MPQHFDRYYRAVTYLESLPKIQQPDYLQAVAGRRFFIERFNVFLRALGNPEKKIKHFIHVGGTSGKGSVATMIHEILTHAGYTTGLYVSPYVTTPIEKIKVNTLLIAPDIFARYVEMFSPVIDKLYRHSKYGRPSWFEIYTAIALQYFADQRVDYAVLEVGLGGRFDATNVIPAPIAAVINTVDFDHTDLLGNTLTKIAKEKAGIIKRGSVVYTPSTNHRNVIRVLQTTTKKINAQLHVIKPPKTPYSLQLHGKAQQHNAALAAAVGRQLGCSKKAITAGLQAAWLPARFEIIQKKPLVILDGGHNKSKIETVVKNLEHLTYKKLYLIIALTKSRNPAAIFKTLIPKATEIICTRFTASTHHVPYPPLQLAKKIKTNKPLTVTLDPFRAVRQTLSRAHAGDCVLITGSLYLTGELRTYWRSEAAVLKNRAL